jgi:hypothetical protein
MRRRTSATFLPIAEQCGRDEAQLGDDPGLANTPAVALELAGTAIELR